MTRPQPAPPRPTSPDAYAASLVWAALAEDPWHLRSQTQVRQRVRLAPGTCLRALQVLEALGLVERFTARVYPTGGRTVFYRRVRPAATEEQALATIGAIR